MRNKSYPILPYGLNLFKVSAVIGGTKKGLFGKVFLLIDTGASFTLISNRVLQQLKYDVTKFEKTQQLITGKGATSPIPVININWFNCAGKVVNNFDILAYDIPKTLKVDGVLGMDFLLNYGAIISLKNRKIYFD